ncbi:leukotriene C4 synthase isoform X2 [Echeneis naucrates]|uniref:leukotriene C4 synthase isoform X2 n=1 Tax=Echeneis naucrates TaxID=173247 RepID=UPI0011142CB3|nr:leukotriene C4 synthase isoform X2 [Echeneis naucrates]
MMDDMVGLAAVSLLGVLEQAYFSLQVIYARRKFSVSPPRTSGPPEFDRVFRAQANCAEYFPIFITVLWTSGVFFSPGLSSVCGLLYLYGRFRYFCGYSQSAQGRGNMSIIRDTRQNRLNIRFLRHTHTSNLSNI